MKKKIALALAAVMSFSSAVSMNLFAADISTASSSIYNYASGTLIVDQRKATVTDVLANLPSNITATPLIGNGDQGTDLIVNFNGRDTSGTVKTFRIELTGAQWGYYLKTAAGVTSYVTKADLEAAVVDGTNADGTLTAAADAAQKNITAGNYFGTPSISSGSTTTDYLYGYSLDYNGGYTNNATLSTNADSLPYTIEFYQDKNVALVTYTANIENNDQIRIPLVMRTTTSGEVKAAIQNTGSSAITATEIILSTTGSGTTTYAKGGVAEGRTTINLNPIIVRENARGTFKKDGRFTIQAPNGYKFAERTSSGSVTTNLAADSFGSGVLDPTIYLHADVPNANTKTGTYAYFNSAMDTITLQFGNDLLPGNAPTFLYFNNLAIVSDDDEPDYSGKTLSISVKNTKESGVTAETVDVAKFIDYSILYTATDAKTFDAGMTGAARDDYELGETATITVTEAVAASWFTRRETSFMLTDADGNKLDGVKFVKTFVDDIRNTVEDTSDRVDENDDKDYWNTTSRYKDQDTTVKDMFYYSADGSTFYFDNSPVKGSGTDKVRLRATFYLSADISFKGDVYVKVGGTAIGLSEVENGGLIKVATVEPKIAVDTKNTPVYIGYQRYNVADVTITELKSGAFVRDGILVIGIGEYGTSTTSSDIGFVPVTESNITTTGDVKVSVIRNTRTVPYVSLTIDRASNTASSITLTNLQLNINHNVPYGSYELNVFGTAIRDNYGTSWSHSDNDIYATFDINGNMKDTDKDTTASGGLDSISLNYKRWAFDNNGVVTDNYINVATEGQNLSLTKEITIYQNSSSVIVDGVAQELQAPTLNVDGRLYIPLRFVVEQFGARESDINYDGITGNIMITLNNRTVVWTKDSEFYVRDGVRMAMSDNGVIARAFISEEDDITYGRTYIPFLYLGNAFDIPVTYDEATGAATYNKK